ncbi:MAG: nucleotidyltransferase family protein, partial [Microvirga sp.]
MRPSEILALKADEIREIIARYPVRNPRIFGSAARGEDAEGSDLDLLVDPLENTSF